MANQTAAERRAAQVEEYGTYRAASVIFIDGVRAFNAGDLVPASHVSREVVPADLVERIPAKSKED